MTPPKDVCVLTPKPSHGKRAFADVMWGDNWALSDGPSTATGLLRRGSQEVRVRGNVGTETEVRDVTAGKGPRAKECR